MMNEQELWELCQNVCSISQKTGEYILSERLRMGNLGFESKGKNDFVTQVDKGAEKLLVKMLSEALPDSGFITEENTIEFVDSDYIWIIDPIDGTTNFIHGLPLFSISIALQFKKKTVLGVVYEVSNRECFYASLGRGAFCNGRTISVSDRAFLCDSLLVTGFPYKDAGKLENWMRLFIDLLRKSHGVRRLGSAAIDLAYVACGRFEAFYEYGLSPWDVAAGAFIVEQAGGQVSDYSGGNNYLFGKELLAGNGKMNEELRAVILSHF
jgi:myo-inositol-1(or 4)-monophosphatase